MRSARLVAAALTGLALVAGAAGVLLTGAAPAEHQSTVTGAGLARPLQNDVSERLQRAFAALAPTPLPPPTPTVVPPTDEPVAAVVAPEEPAPAEPAVVPREWLDADFAAQLLALVNKERAARGIAELAANGALTQGAQDYAATLTQLGTLDHAAAGDLGTRALAAGYGGGALGEALWFGGGQVSPEGAVASWLTSPPHAALLLDPTYVEAGVGCSFREAGDVYEARCVLDLGG